MQAEFEILARQCGQPFAQRADNIALIDFGGALRLRCAAEHLQRAGHGADFVRARGALDRDAQIALRHGLHRFGHIGHRLNRAAADLPRGDDDGGHQREGKDARHGQQHRGEPVIFRNHCFAVGVRHVDQLEHMSMLRVIGPRQFARLHRAHPGLIAGLESGHELCVGNQPEGIGRRDGRVNLALQFGRHRRFGPERLALAKFVAGDGEPFDLLSRIGRISGDLRDQQIRFNTIGGRRQNIGQQRVLQRVFLRHRPAKAHQRNRHPGHRHGQSDQHHDDAAAKLNLFPDKHRVASEM